MTTRRARRVSTSTSSASARSTSATPTPPTSGRRACARTADSTSRSRRCRPTTSCRGRRVVAPCPRTARCSVATATSRRAPGGPPISAQRWRASARPPRYRERIPWAPPPISCRSNTDVRFTTAPVDGPVTTYGVHSPTTSLNTGLGVLRMTTYHLGPFHPVVSL